jgi:opacity protein-like surface antigen
MRRMLLVALAAASVSLSAGAAFADVVCSPVCGLVTSAEAKNLKENQGKTNAGTHISSQGAAHNNAGIKPPTDTGPVILF